MIMHCLENPGLFGLLAPEPFPSVQSRVTANRTENKCRAKGSLVGLDSDGTDPGMQPSEEL